MKNFQLDGFETTTNILLCVIIGIVIIILIWEPLASRFKRWKLKREFDLRDRSAKK